MKISDEKKKSQELMDSEEGVLHCGLGVQGKLSREQTAPSSLLFPALFSAPPLRRAIMSQPRNPDRQENTTTPKGAQGGSPTCCAGARPREKEQLLSRCSLQSAVHCGVEMGGQRWLDTEAHPHPVRTLQVWPCSSAVEPG